MGNTCSCDLSHKEQEAIVPIRAEISQIKELVEEEEKEISKISDFLKMLPDRKVEIVKKIQSVYRGRRAYKIFLKRKANLVKIEQDLISQTMFSFLSNFTFEIEQKVGQFNENGWLSYTDDSPNIVKSNKDLFYSKLLTYKNNDCFYVGWIDVNLKRNFEGTMFFKSGKKVLGSWANDELNGWGREVHKSGYCFEGLYRDGKLNGPGVMIRKDGLMYIGNFKHGMKEGKGKEISNEYEYEGEFCADKWEGMGKIVLRAANEEYEGEFKKNMKHGRGTLKLGNGATLKGEFAEDKANGDCEYLYPDGSVYHGRFKENKKHGIGTVVCKGGLEIMLTFNTGKPEGQATIRKGKETVKMNVKDMQDIYKISI